MRYPSENEKYKIDDFNKNFAELEGRNRLTIVKISQADYDAIEEYDNNTVYYADDDRGKIKQYLGATELSSGSKPATASVSVVGLYPKIGNATKEE